MSTFPHAISRCPSRAFLCYCQSIIRILSLIILLYRFDVPAHRILLSFIIHAYSLPCIRR